MTNADVNVGLFGYARYFAIYGSVQTVESRQSLYSFVLQHSYLQDPHSV